MVNSPHDSISNVQDITEKKKTEAEITRLASFPELNPNPVVEVDFECNIKYTNPAGKALFPDIQTSGSCHPFFADWKQSLKTLGNTKTGSINREVKIGEHWFFQQLNLIPQIKSVRIYAVVIDDLKKAEDALQQSEQRWATTLSSIGDAVIATDVEGKVTFMNKVAEALTGWTLREAFQIPLKKVFHIINEHTRKEVESPVTRVLKEGLIVGLANHTVLLQKNGAEVPIDDSGAPIKDKDGKITGVVLVFRNIGERKKSEEKISQQAFMIANANDAIIGYDLDLKVTFWNKSAEKLYGYTADEAIGKTSVDLLKPAYVNITREELINRLAISGHAETESIRFTKSGRQLDIEAHVILLRNEAGKSIGYVSVDRDVTEQKKILDSLKQSEERYHSLFSNMMDGFAFCKMIFDGENKPVDFVYLEINGAFERITGLKRDLVIGKNVTQAIPGIKEANPELFEIYGRVALSCNSERFEIFFKPLSLWLSISVYCPAKGYFAAVFEDITERKKAEQELWRAKNDWERTFDSVPDFIAILDNNHRILRANKAMTQQLGVTPEQAVGENCYKCVHGTSLPPEFCPHAKTLVDGKEHVAEVHEPRLGGDFLVSTTPLKDENGKIIGSVHVARNITERKKAEDALGKLNRHLRAISNSNQALMHATDETALTQEVCNIIIHDCGYALVWVGMAEHDKNKTVRPIAYAGFDKEYIDQLNVTWADKPRGRGPTGTVIRTGKPYVCRNMNVDPNFEPWREQATKRGYTASLVLPLFTFENETFGALNIYSCEPNPFTEEEIKLLTELANDFAYGITMLRLQKDKEQAAEVLRKQAELIDLSPDAIIVKKPDDTITFWSKGAEKLYGWTKEEAIGQPTSSLFRTKSSEPLKEINLKLKQTGHWSGQLIHHTKDNQEVAVQSWWLGKPDEYGRIKEILESNVDMTERNRIQTKLEENACILEEYANQMEELANERAKQLNQAERLATIGQTAGMVGHDIRNPLQAIVGELYLAKDELYSLPDNPAKKSILENITSIEENLYYIDKIVADLQDYTKPLKPSKEKVNIEKIIEEALLIVAIPSNLEVSISIEEGFPLFTADFSMLKRVLMNLIQNAVQAMPNGGKLKVNAERQGKQVCISVQDTGEGIPEEVQSKLFTPLFTTKSKGQGFGLAVVKRLVEVQDGKISFQSQNQKGTTFIIHLPIN